MNEWLNYLLMETEWLRSLAEQEFVFKFQSLLASTAWAANSSGSLAGALTSLLQVGENKEDMTGC